MPRIARVVVPGIPHHVTQRGNRRQESFLCDGDYEYYLALMADHCRDHAVDVWAYCLMPNHVHLVLVPADEDGLRRALGEAHRQYACVVNDREGWRGHFWQERFHSFPMDEAHLLMAVRYVELNPVRAGLTRRASEWRWSSVRAHLEGRDDVLVRAGPMRELVPDWGAYLREGLDDKAIDTIRLHERTGRPLGNAKFIESLEEKLGRKLKPARRGRKAAAPWRDGAG